MKGKIGENSWRVKFDERKRRETTVYQDKGKFAWEILKAF